MTVLLALALASPSLAGSAAVRGTISQVLDGDTYEFQPLEGGDPVRVRIYGVDCPEHDQPGGDMATRFAREQAQGVKASIRRVATDAYGRTVATVTVRGQDLSEALIHAGMAWVAPKYCKRKICDRWLIMENGARQRAAGIWGLPESPDQPWHWRKSHPRKK